MINQDGAIGMLKREKMKYRCLV